LAQEQEEYNTLRAKDIMLFLELLIDPQILEIERQFRVKHTPLSQIRLEDDDSDNIPSSPLGRMGIGSDDEHIEEEEEEEEGEMDNDVIISHSLVRSVTTIDSFKNRNIDYIRFS
jgi:hypothetical protein